MRAAKLARHGNLILRDAERREDALVPGVAQDADDARALGRIEIGVHVGLCELQPRKRRRSRGERLSRRRVLAGHVALRNRPFLDRPDRLARNAIEHIEQSELRRLRDDIDRLAAVVHGQQLRSGDEIVVPQIMMQQLVVPEALAGAKVERQQRIAEQVVPFAIAAPQIEGRRAEREIPDATLLVDRELGPRVRAAGGLPRIGRPGVVAELARARNRVERPDEPAGQHIEGADVSGWRVVPFAGRRTKDEQILEHMARRSRLRAAGRKGRAPEPLAQIHETVYAEARNRLTCSCVELLQVAARRKDDAAIRSILALPVVEPAIGRRAFGREGPDFLTGRRIEREHRAIFADHIHHVIHDKGAEGEAPCGARRWMEPLKLELIHVGFVDLPERGILRSFDAASWLAPRRIQPRARLAEKGRDL